MATRPTWNTKVLNSISRTMIRLNRMAMSWMLSKKKESRGRKRHSEISRNKEDNAISCHPSSLKWLSGLFLAQNYFPLEPEIRLSVVTVSNSCLHKEYQLDSRFGPQQLTEGVDKQVEGEQAELNQQHQRVVACLERLRPEGWAPGRTVVPRWIQGCTALAHTLHRNINPHTAVLTVWVFWSGAQVAPLLFPNAGEVGGTYTASGLHLLWSERVLFTWEKPKSSQKEKQGWPVRETGMSACHSRWTLQMWRLSASPSMSDVQWVALINPAEILWRELRDTSVTHTHSVLFRCRAAPTLHALCFIWKSKSKLKPSRNAALCYMDWVHFTEALTSFTTVNIQPLGKLLKTWHLVFGHLPMNWEEVDGKIKLHLQNF